MAERERYAPILDAIRSLGFQVRLGDHFSEIPVGIWPQRKSAPKISTAWPGKEVKMVLFGGGEEERRYCPIWIILPSEPSEILCEATATVFHPQRLAKKALVTYYGALPGMFENLTPYNKQQFFSHFVEGPAKAWPTGACCPGREREFWPAVIWECSPTDRRAIFSQTGWRAVFAFLGGP